VKIERIPEPELIFKGMNKSTYCKLGLGDSGSYAADKEGHGSKINIAIIGTKELVEKTREWVALCNEEIISIPHKGKTDINKHLFPDFPGFEQAFMSKLVIEDSFVQTIKNADLFKLHNTNEFVYQNGLLNLFRQRTLEMFENNERRPDVILCVLTDEMYDICATVGDYHKKIKKKEKDLDQMDLFHDLDTLPDGFIPKSPEPLYRNFRSCMKKIAMEPSIRMPIQILRPATIDPEAPETQNSATKAWNFCTGIYYKSGNHPWILDNMDSKSCYLGISFYHKKTLYGDDVYTAMAHLFSNDFADIVLKGKPVNFDKKLGGAYLDYKQAKSLLHDALEVYKRMKRTLPERLVIHKTSDYTEGEISGLSEILDEAGLIYDLVYLKKASFRLIRHGDMPVPRGTYFEFHKDLHFLYTKGFIPELRTYPGVHVPAPFEVIKRRGDSSYKEICREILALTKLNWNTADFCCGLPITIGFSKNVGQVLREFDAKDNFEPEKSYRFYM
jgi:hypothetical protein